MQEQEMQFASPDWRPPQQRNGQTDVDQSTAYIPQPVNTHNAHASYPNQDYGQSQQQAPVIEGQPPAYDDTYQYGAGYRGANYAAPGQRLRPLPPARRRNRWPWLFVLILVVALASGSMFTSFNQSSFRGDRGGFPSFQQPVQNDGQTFSGFSAHPTITIVDNYGSITVNTNGQDGTVLVQSDQGPTQFTSSSGKNDLNITASSFDGSSNNLNVTVGNGVDLVLTTQSDGITVTGVTGQMNLTSGGGSITLSQVAMTGKSTITTNSGDINFDGSIDPNGAYNLDAGTGSIDVSLPANSSYHLHVSGANISNGSFTTDLPVPPSDQNVNTFDIPVGNPPRADLYLTTNGGSINLMNTGNGAGN
jgi:Putative adhesin